MSEAAVTTDHIQRFLSDDAKLQSHPGTTDPELGNVALSPLHECDASPRPPPLQTTDDAPNRDSQASRLFTDNPMWQDGANPRKHFDVDDGTVSPLTSCGGSFMTPVGDDDAATSNSRGPKQSHFVKFVSDKTKKKDGPYFRDGGAWGNEIMKPSALEKRLPSNLELSDSRRVGTSPLNSNSRLHATTDAISPEKDDAEVVDVNSEERTEEAQLDGGQASDTISTFSNNPISLSKGGGASDTDTHRQSHVSLSLSIAERERRTDVSALLVQYNIPFSEHDSFLATFYPIIMAHMNNPAEERMCDGGGDIVNPIHSRGDGRDHDRSMEAAGRVLTKFGVPAVLHSELIERLCDLLKEPEDELQKNVIPWCTRRTTALCWGLFFLTFVGAAGSVVLFLYAMGKSCNRVSLNWCSSTNITSLSLNGTAALNLTLPVPTVAPLPTALPSTVPAQEPTPGPSLPPTPSPTMDVTALVGLLTSEEKYSLLSGVGYAVNSWDPEEGFYIANTPAVPRLGIPSLNIHDGAQGFRTSDVRMVGQVTSWPCGLGFAATWDAGLVRRFAEAAAAEFRAKGANAVMGPALNVHRVASGGRNAEYMSGEDPYLGAVLAAPYVRGFQSRGVLCIMASLLLGSQEADRGTLNAVVNDARATWEVFYPPYAAAVEAGVAGAMCAHNKVNGTHACSSAQLLDRDLKATMGFRGFVMSDLWAAYESGAAAGLDLVMPGNLVPGPIWADFNDPAHLAALAPELVDDMVARVLTPMVAGGLMGRHPPVCAGGTDCAKRNLYEANATSGAHRALSLAAATQSVLLLQNKAGVLPLRAPAGHPARKVTLAVLGSACHAPHDPASLAAAGFDAGNYYVVGGSGRVLPAAVTSVVMGIERAAAASATTFEILVSLTDDAATAAAVLAAADTVVTCGGATSSELHDRASLALEQQAFIGDVASAAKAAQVPVTVVMLAPGPVLTPFKDDVDAIVAIFLGGAATGDAVAAVLFGDHNPASKSPVTFPASEADAVRPCEGGQVDWCTYNEGLLVGYRALDAAVAPVAFPFGHGLSFTSFAYSWAAPPEVVVLAPTAPAAGPSPGSAAAAGAAVTAAAAAVVVRFAVAVANTGARDGAEVVQVYGSYAPGTGVPPLVKTLRRFERVEVATGATATVHFELDAAAFSTWDNVAWAFVPVPGKYQLFVGASSRDTRLEGTVDIPEAH